MRVDCSNSVVLGVQNVVLKQFRKFEFVGDLSERVGMVIPVTRLSVTSVHSCSIRSEGQK